MKSDALLIPMQSMEGLDRKRKLLVGVSESTMHWFWLEKLKRCYYKNVGDIILETVNNFFLHMMSIRLWYLI